MNIKTILLVTFILNFLIPENTFKRCHVGFTLKDSSLSKLKIHSEATFKQESANLIWSRYAFGQNWDGKQCLGRALKLNFDETNNHLVREQRNTELDWRIPTSFELENLYSSIFSSHSFENILLSNFSAIYLWTSYNSSGATPYYINFTNRYLGLCEQSKCKFNTLLVADAI